MDDDEKNVLNHSKINLTPVGGQGGPCGPGGPIIHFTLHRSPLITLYSNMHCGLHVPGGPFGGIGHFGSGGHELTKMMYF